MTARPPAGHRARRLRAWGAEWIDASTASFRVWAPGMPSLGLRVGGSDLPMTRDADGWFERTVADLAVGAPYAYVTPDGKALPDPAARAQVDDVHGPSRITAASSYSWKHAGWSGRPWHEAVIYELHPGTFTEKGTFAAAVERLPDLAALGITAVEVMPVAQFGGERGWGYDGVLLYAPHNAYGSPDDLKAFVDAAHGHGLMVLLDVVYNHFGPDGNYLPLLAPAFFDESRHTPWGAAIAYEKLPVRQFFMENALYWLDEFRFDGLRFDAVDQIRDPRSQTEVLVEIAGRIRSEFPDRHIHLTTEDNRNVTFLHERDDDGKAMRFTGEWNDDFHNAGHVLATAETDGYYEDFAVAPAEQLARILAQGFAYQGEPSPHADGEARGMPSAHQPPTAFIDFLQNHDQIGNRAMGERLSLLAEEQSLRALTAILLLSPHIPLLFMGQEWGETRPFLFFTDFHGELADAVRRGRRREFAKFVAFNSEAKQREIPDPNALSTFEASKIDWSARTTPEGTRWLDFTRSLLALRKREIVPLLAQAGGHAGCVVAAGSSFVAVDWRLRGKTLQLRANFGAEATILPPVSGRTILAIPEANTGGVGNGVVPSHSVVVAIDDPAADTAAE